MTEFEQIKQQISDLQQEIDNLKSSATIPIEVQDAFKFRLLGSLKSLTVSTKDANSEDVSVDENGTATYSVMNDPDGFLEISIDGTTYYLPYFT